MTKPPDTWGPAWVPICEDCWYTITPNDYFPYHLFSEWSEVCAGCGENTFANVHVRREYLNAKQRAQVDTV